MVNCMPSPIDHELLSRLAYQLWLDRGQPIGSPEIDWNLAVKFCTQQRSPTDVPAQEQSEQTASNDPVAPTHAHSNGAMRLKDESAEVPMEVPPTTPGIPDVPPTKAVARRTIQPKTNSRLSKA